MGSRGIWTPQVLAATAGSRGGGWGFLLDGQQGDADGAGDDILPGAVRRAPLPYSTVPSSSRSASTRSHWTLWGRGEGAALTARNRSCRSRSTTASIDGAGRASCLRWSSG